ncbi:MAG: tape measure protein [Desulfovibrionaceae bacterium]
MAAETRIIVSARDLATSQFRRISMELDRLKSRALSLGTAVGGVAMGALGTSLYSASIDVERLDKSFAKVTGSARDGADELAFLRKEAERVGFSFYGIAESTRNLYAAAKNTSLQGQGVRDLVSSVMSAGADMALSQEQMGGVFYALEQMVSKGTVSMEELKRQLGDRLPGAMQIAADAMGVTTGELLKMVESGKLMAEDFLPRFTQEMGRRFAGDAMPRAQRALNLFKDTLKDVRAEIARGGFTDAVMAGMEKLRDMLRDPDVQQGLAGFAKGVTESSVALLNLAPALGAVIQLIRSVPGEWLETGLIGYALFGKAGAFVIGGVALVNDVLDKVTEQARKDVQDAMRSIEDSTQRMIQDLQDFSDVYHGRPKKERGLNIAYGKVNREPVNKAPRTGGASGDDDKSAAGRAKLLAGWEEYYNKRRMSAEAFYRWQLAQEERAYRASEAYRQASPAQQSQMDSAFREYRSEKLRALVDEQIEAMRREAEERQRILDQFDADYLRTIQGETAFELAQIEARKQAALAAGADKVRVAQWEAAELARVAEAERRPVAELLDQAGQKARAGGPRSAQMRAELEAELAGYQAREGYKLASDEERRRIDRDYAAWRQAQEAEITAQLRQEERERLAASDSLADAMTLAWETYADRVDGLAGRMSDIVTGMFDDFNAKMGEWTSTGEFEVEDMVRSWIASFGRLASEQLITGPLAAMLSGSSASEAGGLAGMLAGLFHSGGVVGETGGARRVVSPLVFAGARRFHGGGLVGDEMGIIAKRGEEVLTRSDPRHRDNLRQDASGADASGGVRIINTLDPEIVQDFLSSSAGERVILNVIRRNPQMLRR